MADLHKNQYNTITKEGSAIFKDKGSKFIGYALPFFDANLLKETLEPIKQAHHQARHYCYAYRINPIKIEERANDDGEPAHSAGTPILGQLQSAELINVLVVVVRYFGGTKLGIPGLINAYKSATKSAIEASKITIKEIQTEIQISFPYAEMNNVMRVIKQLNPTIVQQEMHLDVTMNLAMRRDKIEKLIYQLSLLHLVTIKQ